MKKLLLTLIIGFGLITSCQKEDIKPNNTENQITASTIILEVDGTVNLKATIIYTDINGNQKSTSNSGAENVNWNEKVSISASSGFTLYGPSGSTWSSEPTTFKLYKDNQLIDIKYNSSSYSYSNK